jgi:hypothetical protein
MKSNFILNPDFFTTNLYNVSDEKNSDLNLRGSNQKQLVIVYRAENTPLDEVFLAKILTAVQYDLQQDTTLIELRKNQNFSFKNISKTLSPKHVISLGVSPKNIGVNLNDQLYKPRNIKNCCFLFTDKLSKIAEDKNKKGALWECLQSMFTVPKNETDA